MSQVRKDVLNGWKEIAAYLGRDPRTVERWEKQRHLPVRRMPGGGRASVYALVSELDAWLAQPSREPEPPATDPSTPPTPAFFFTEENPAPRGPYLAGGAALPSGDATGATAPERSDASGPPASRSTANFPEPPPALARSKLWVAGLACAALAFVFLRWRYPQIRSLVTGSSRRTADTQQVRTLVPSSQIAGVEDLYLEGCYDSELRTPESLQRAEDAFSAAISRDPKYAPAYSGLASTFLLLREYSLMSEKEAYDQATRAADEALLLDPEFPQAHAVEGFVAFFWEWDGAKAKREFESAEQLEPSLALAHHWYGSMLTHEGRYKEALQELQTAQKLEPSSPAIMTSRAYALGLSGHRTEAQRLLQEAVRTERPGQFRWPATMHQVLGSLSLLPPRDVPRFLSESLLAADLRHDQKTVREMRLGTEAYRAKGEVAMWQRLLLDEQRLHGVYPATYAEARYKAALGQPDEALNDLKELYVRHDPALIGISIDPLFAELHHNARFIELRRAVGLPESP